MPAAVIFTCAAMLALGAAPLPYGYYTLLRLVACGVLAYAAFLSHARRSQVLPWVYGGLALLFNPFVKVHLSKDLWAVVDLGTSLLLVATRKQIETAGGVNSQKQTGPE